MTNAVRYPVQKESPQGAICGPSSFCSALGGKPGRASTSLYAGDVWSMPMKNSSPNKAKDVLTESDPVTNEQVAAEVQADIIDLTAKQVSRLAHRTEAAAKRWKAQDNAPDAASLINLARNHERTRRWLLWKIAGDWSRIMDPRVLTDLHAFLWRAADAGDSSARALLQRIYQAPASSGAKPSPDATAGDVDRVSGHFAEAVAQ